MLGEWERAQRWCGPSLPRTHNPIKPTYTLPPTHLSQDMMTADYQETWARFIRMMHQNAKRFKTSRSWRRNMGFEC